MLSKKKIENKLAELKPILSTRYSVKRLGLFGSYSNSLQTEESDVDILVQFQKGHKGFFNFIRLKTFLENELGAKVDLVMKDSVKPRLKKKIFGEVRYV